MKRKLILFTMGICLLIALTSCLEDPDPFEREPYPKVGDLRPGGGYVFYDKGEYRDGWRYLEAAPEDISLRTDWGLSGLDCLGTEIAIGTGFANTDTIIVQLNHSELERAAQKCTNYQNNGYGWFLPSKDELNLMYQNLHLEGKGDFETEEDLAHYYWSSSTDSLQTTWRQSFQDGSIEATHSRAVNCSVRPIRRF